MLRVHVVQVCDNLSDRGMEDLLYEAESARRFCGLSLAGAIPDESTILHFRHLLERCQLGDTLLAASASGTRRCIKRARATSGTSG